MTQSKTQFDDALLRAGNLIQVGAFLEGRPVAGLDHQECYRAALVLGVSCLDYYVHSLAWEASMATSQGQRKATPKYLEFRVPLGLALANAGSGSWHWLGTLIQETHSSITLQRPEKISEYIKIVDARSRLWERLAVRLGVTKEALRRRLNLLIDRRNMIAHEADIDPAWGVPRSLSHAEIDDAFAFLHELVDAIDAECW